MVKVERVRGTRDFLPAEMKKRREMERIMREVAIKWGYEEVQTPTFEHAELFTLKSGEEILKEMYEFVDKGGRHLALRPELTAPVIRMFVNELKMARKPLRFFYFGNCFRYEEPQRARYREFWQFGAEIIGADSPPAQAEIIALAHEILNALHIKGSIEIGHVGILRDFLAKLSKESGVSLNEDEKNRIMRLIDKGAKEQIEEFMRAKGFKEDAIADLFGMVSLKGEDALKEAREMLRSGDGENGENSGGTALDKLRELEAVAELLSEGYGTPFTLNLGIARGLDYYTGLVFEIYAEAEKLGAQRQICGGGSYRIAHLFGGEDTPSTGFAFGFDRLSEIFPFEAPSDLKVVVVPVLRKADAGLRRDLQIAALKTARILRSHFVTLTDVLGRNLSAQLAYADAIGASFAVIIGERELKEGRVTLRNLRTGEQESVSVEECVRKIKEQECSKEG